MSESPATIKLAINDWTLSEFDPSLEGVDTITQDGTEIPADQEKAVRDAAKANGVKLKKVRS